MLIYIFFLYRGYSAGSQYTTSLHTEDILQDLNIQLLFCLAEDILQDIIVQLFLIQKIFCRMPMSTIIS